MELQALEVRRLELQLVHSLATSGGVHAHRPVVLVRVETDLGSGWGECAALASPTYTEEYADGAERVLADVFVPLLASAGRVVSCAEDAMRVVGVVRGHHMAKAALEMALLDAELRSQGRSLAAWLGAVETVVAAGATVGTGSPSAVVAEVASAVAAGFTRVKCKVGPGADVAVMRAVRAAFPDLLLAVDANGSYRRVPDAATLDALDELGLVAIEQPLPAADLVGHGELARRLDTPVVLDESITGLGELETALALGSCDGVAVKASRLGGLANARILHHRCRDAGVRLSAGGMLETGLGRAAALALAALPGFDLPGDLGPSNRYFVPDVTREHVLDAGGIAVPDGPGLGVEPEGDVLDAATARVVTYRLR